MSGVAAEGGARGSAARQWLEGVVEVLRERRSERRAQAAARAGAAPPRVRRSTVAAAFDARLAVRAGVRLDDFLRHRLARYAGRLPVPLEALPVTVDVEGGEAVIRRKGRARSFGPRPEAEPGARGSLAPAGALGARELRDAEGSLDALDARIADARARTDAAGRDLAAAVASGEIVARPAVEASPEQLGRPPVPSEAPVLALRGFVVALLVAEAWRFSGPILAASGIATTGGLEAALRSSLTESGLALLLAAGGATTAFTFAWLALARGADALGAASTGRRPLLVLASACAAALVPGVAAAAAAPDRWAQLALLAAVPFAGAALVRASTALARTRAAAAAEALAWDRERAREAVARGRREEACLRAAEELRSEEAAREGARRRLARLQRAAIAHARAAELTSRAEMDRLDRLSEALACALELDRYLFVRFAAARAHLAADPPARARVVDAGVGAERLGVAG